MHELLSIINCLNVDETILVFRKVMRLNKHQRSVLERLFTVHNYPNGTTLEELALQTGLHKGKLYQWFNNRRQTEKKLKGGAILSLLEKWGSYMCNEQCFGIFIMLANIKYPEKSIVYESFLKYKL